MDAQQFAYWLQGFAELNQQPPSAEQWQSIRDHLATVFTKVTPAVSFPTAVPWPKPTADDSKRLQPLRADCKAVTTIDGVTWRKDALGDGNTYYAA